MAHIAAYNSAFHAGRTLIFSHGYVERSHACLAVALRHFYSDDDVIEPFLGTFDKMRVSRHNVQYGGSLICDEEAEFSCRFARSFCDAVEIQLNKPPYDLFYCSRSFFKCPPPVSGALFCLLYS